MVGIPDLFLGSALAARSAYRGAVVVSMGYVEQVKVAFDLFRNELLKHLGGVVRPDDDEAARWQALVAHWYRNVPGAVEAHEPPTPPAATRSPVSLGTWLFLLSIVVGALGCRLPQPSSEVGVDNA